ncbi:MAG: ribose-phosphate pyrophosphokinase [Parvibaculaceae bacterium]
MAALVFPLPGNESLARAVAHNLGGDMGTLRIRRFPDGESYVRYETPLEGRRIILVSTLDRPDDKFLPLLFSAAAARDLGATEVGLVAPYLAYMRQDRRFKPGEAITSAHFAQTLGRWIDWLVTVDPHLHRRSALSEIYPIPCATLHAAPAISAWIRETVAKPVLVGPDSESEQWVGAVAKDAGAPFVVLQKTRRGDRDVEVSVPDVERWRDCTPVLVDDIISTARTMIETAGHLNKVALAPPVCIGIHAVFADRAYADLQAVGPQRIVTCNTIAHPSNAIDISPLIVSGIQSL